MGIDTAIPSGILCAAIAIAKAIPRCRLATPLKNTAMPSGKLWIVIPSAIKIPVG